MISDADALDRIPFPVLIGDIGGTNARFALLEGADTAIERMPDVRTDDYRTLEDAIADVVLPRTTLRPRSAMLALAGPIAGDRIALTNSDWVVEPGKTLAQTGMEEMILLNDFEALSLSLPGLTDADIDPVGAGTVSANGAKVVLGPGTGLGAGALVRGRQSWIPVPGEGGHVDLGPVSDRDFAIWPHLEKLHGRISAETLLCGAGLVRLYRGICTTDGVAPRFASPAEITEAGLSNKDRQAVEALTLFATYLGRLAGNMALIFMARGGVYLAGGISARIAPVLKSGAFRAPFLDKAPHDGLLEAMPTSLIVSADPALAGIAAFACAPSRFVIDLTGRRWRASA